jgi:hypothetical protein
MPGAGCARSLVCKWKKAHKHSRHGHTGNTRHSPRNGFNGFLRALPGDRAFLPPSLANFPASLTPASGRQDHTTSPSASCAARLAAPSASTASRPAFRDDREPPLCGTGRDGSIAVSTKSKSEIFFERGLDATGKSVPQSSPSPLRGGLGWGVAPSEPARVDPHPRPLPARGRGAEPQGGQSDRVCSTREGRLLSSYLTPL